MPDIEDGETVEVQGSAKDPYILRNVGGVYSCSCPAWRNQSTAIERRTCKHLRKYRGDEAETERLGGELSALKPARKPAAAKTSTVDGEAVASDVPGLLLAHPWDTLVDLTGWWMSEKLDGVRAYWDGQQFISRQGNVYMAPDWFIEDLPKDVHLDGELWSARKAFQRTVSIVRRQDKSKDWEEITFVVFDAPQVNDVFEARMAYLQQFLDELQPKYARPHAQERCQSIDHLKEELAKVESDGGEGLMMRQPGSRYEAGRSHSLLKVKTFHDAEAKVLEYLPGTGKHKGRMGALNVEMKDGTKFSIGTGFSDKERENPPPIGSIVTFRYQELSDRGVPRFPSFVRLRTDMDSLSDSPIPKTPVTASSGALKLPDMPERSADPLMVSEESLERAVEAAMKTQEALIKEAVGNVKSTPSAASKNAAPAAKSSNVVDFAAARQKKMNFAPEEEVPLRDSSKLRYFEFVEGNSSKFWAIWMNDVDVTTRYGRIGSDGQEKTKSFKDVAAASKYYDEIIEEKLGKGYEEKSGPEDDDEEDDDDFEDDDELDDDEDSDDNYDSDDGLEDEDDDDWEDDEGDDGGDEEVEDFSPDHGGKRREYSKFSDDERNAHVICYCSKCYPLPMSAPNAVAAVQVPSKAPTSTAVATVPKPTATATTTTTTGSSSQVRYFEYVDDKSNKFWSIWMTGAEVTVRYGKIGTAGQEKPKAFPSESAAKKYYDEIVEEKVGKGYVEKEQD